MIEMLPNDIHSKSRGLRSPEPWTDLEEVMVEPGDLGPPLDVLLNVSNLGVWWHSASVEVVVYALG